MEKYSNIGDWKHRRILCGAGGGTCLFVGTQELEVGGAYSASKVNDVEKIFFMSLLKQK